MSDNHPITPPDGYVDDWRLTAANAMRESGEHDLDDYFVYFATLAARWGADQELEAVVDLLGDKLSEPVVRALYASRRPEAPTDEPDAAPDAARKAPTIKELMWALLTLLDGVGDSDIQEMTGLSPEKCKAISEIRRKAVEIDDWLWRK